MGSIQSIFMHADGADIILMIFGLIGAVGDGISMPLRIYITSKLMNAIGDSSSGVESQFIHSINEVYWFIPNLHTHTYTHKCVCFSCFDMYVLIICILSY